MPRNIAGVYTLPLPPVNPGDVVESAWANTTLDDLALAITDSLDRYGRGGMVAPFRLDDGTEAAPGLAFVAQPGTGLYRTAPGVIGFSIIGNHVASIDANGVNVEGNLTLLGASRELVATDPLLVTAPSVDLDGILAIKRGTVPAWSATRSVVDVNGSGLATVDGGETMTIFANAYEEAGAWKFAAAGRAVALNLGSVTGTMTMELYRSSAAGAAPGDPVSFVRALYVSEDGEFVVDAPTAGIPAAILHNGASVFGQVLQLQTIAGTDGPRLGFVSTTKAWNTGINGATDGWGVFEGGDSSSFGTLRLGIAVGGDVHIAGSRIVLDTNGDIHAHRNNDSGVIFFGNTNNHYLFYDGAGNYQMPNGHLSLQAAYTVYAGAFNVISERRLKQDIVRVKPGALARINDLAVKEFAYKTDPHKRHVGLIADDVDARYSDGKGIATNAVLFDLVAAVQELSRKVH